MLKNFGLTIFLMSLLLWVFSSCQGSSDPDEVVFMAGFKPQANLPFAAVYIAEEKGYFDEQNIDIEILHSGGGGENIKSLLSNKVHVTTADANSVLKYRASQTAPLVAIALFGQTGQQAFVSLKKSGIDSPDDWPGKKFGYKISIPPDYLAIIDAQDLNRDSIDEIQVGFDPRILIEGKVDILAVFKSNEPDTLRRMGHDVNVFEAAKYGVPTLGLTYVVTETRFNNYTNQNQRFLKATLKAVDFIKNNEEEALDIVMKYADKEDKDHMRFMLNTEINDAISSITNQNGIGWMEYDQWKAFHDSLRLYNAIDMDVNIKDAMTTDLLMEIYENGELVWP